MADIEGKIEDSTEAPGSEKIEDSTENPRSFNDNGETGQAGPEQDNMKASPEEQQDYELLSIRSRKMIFGQSKEKILTMLGSSSMPAEGMGKVASMILKSLVSSAEQQGRKISPDAVMNAGANVIDDLNELAKSKGVFKYDSQNEEQKQLKDAMLYGVKFYGDGMIANGEITSDMKKMAQQQIQQGIAEEQNKAPQKTPVAQAVGQAINPGQSQGLVGSAMQGGM